MMIQILIALMPFAFAVTPNFELKKGFVGPLPVKTSITAVRRAFPTAELKDVLFPIENTLEPSIEIHMNGGTNEIPDLLVRGPDGLIYGVLVYSPDFRTSTGLGVGSTLGDIQNLHSGLGRLGMGEGCYCVVVNDLKMSFKLEATKEVSESDGDLAKIPPSTKVRAVWVH